LPSEDENVKTGQKGFTLIELLFAILIGVMLIAASYIAMTAGQQSSGGVERKVAAQQDLRAAMQVMGMELSMASYNPHSMPNIWHDLPPVGNLVQCQGSINQASKGIREATPTAITVEMDVGESCLVGDERGEIIRYAYHTGSQSLTRETANCGQTRGASAAAHFLGDDPDAIPRRPRTVRVINQDLNLSVFRYYNGIGQGAELAIDCPTGKEASCAEIPNIRRIDITLAVETDEVDPASKRRGQMIYSTSVLVRNHVF
jgi:prepilin-type N-terminal cleavage/methylation domain-containing protein